VDPFADQIQRDLAEIGKTTMPFGKYGPGFCPPDGTPIYDLPLEYLAWFARKGGFPKGRLGELLQIVHHMKVEGLECVFDTLRAKRGAKTPLRPPRKRSFDFGNTD
jgi:uncharacterized protein (DUF3820 family)